MSAPPKEKRGLGTALENTNVTVYHSALALQRLGRGRSGNV